MLDRFDQGQDVAGWIEALPCLVTLPARLRDDFEKSGPVQTVFEEQRSGVRLNCRGTKHRAALEVRQTLPAFPRAAQWCAVYTSNFSKKGCGFFHGHVLYPGEQFSLILLTGLRRTVEVMWCRRIDKSCFEFGAQFIDSSSDTVSKA